MTLLFHGLKMLICKRSFNSDMSIPEDIDEQLSLSSFHSGKVRCFSSSLCFFSLTLDPDVKRAAVSTTYLKSAGKWFYCSGIISACAGFRNALYVYQSIFVFPINIFHLLRNFINANGSMEQELSANSCELYEESPW